MIFSQARIVLQIGTAGQYAMMWRIVVVEEELRVFNHYAMGFIIGQNTIVVNTRRIAESVPVGY